MIRHACLLLAMVCSVSAASAQVLRGDLWVTNGGVYASTVVGNTLYMGVEGQAAVGNQVRKGIAAISPPTAAPLPWDPQCNGSVYSILPSGSTLFVGGDFSQIGGQPRNNLAQVDTALAATATSFN